MPNPALGFGVYFTARKVTGDTATRLARATAITGRDIHKKLQKGEAQPIMYNNPVRFQVFRARAYWSTSSRINRIILVLPLITEVPVFLPFNRLFMVSENYAPVISLFIASLLTKPKNSFWVARVYAYAV
jgi:hypothetical protein